jgi:hypothetical protein
MRTLIILPKNEKIISAITVEIDELMSIVFSSIFSRNYFLKNEPMYILSVVSSLTEY